MFQSLVCSFPADLRSSTVGICPKEMLLVRPPVIGVVVGRSANNAAANLHHWVAGVGLDGSSPAYPSV